MFGNGLDMHGHIDSTFNSPLPGGVWLIQAAGGSYSGPAGRGKIPPAAQLKLSASMFSPQDGRTCRH